MASAGNLQIYNHEIFGQIKAILDTDGNPWFIAKNIAEALGYTNPQKAIRDHCKGVNETVTPSKGGNQLTKIIPESDLYRLILRSKLPQAEAFQDWVTEEILPSIRKHGVYRKEKEPEPELVTEKSFIEHDGCFWLATDIIAKELERIGIKDGADEVQLGFEGDLDDMLKNYITSIDGRKYVKEYGVNYLLLSIALETLEEIDKDRIYALCARIETILGSLKGKDLTGIRISAVMAYQEVVSRLSSSGKDINFVRSLIRYKQKDLSVDEIAVLTGYSRNDIDVYLEDLESSGMMNMADILTAVPEALPAPVTSPVKSLPVKSTASPTQEMINKLGYNEAVVLSQLQTMISESGRKRIQITYADWLKKFPFRSEATLQRTVRKLENMGLIQSRRMMLHYQRIKEYWVEG